MSEIEALITAYNDSIGDNQSEIGDAAQDELDDLRRWVQVGIEIYEAHNKGLYMARDAIIAGTLRRLIAGK